MEVVFIKSKVELLKEKIRPVTEEDERTLPKFSYSRLSVLKQCPYQYDLKYNKNLKTSESTLALSLGTLLHYILEQKGKMLKAKTPVDFDLLQDILQNGIVQITDHMQTEILGLKALKEKYWEIWEVSDSEGRTYNEKIELFQKVLKTEMERDEWIPYLFEHPFDFVYDNKIILNGFIDRVDKRLLIDKENTREIYRVVDYKTNKKPYEAKDLATSLQFGVYALAILNEFNEIPTDYQYRLILLDIDQKALTLGWENRIITALDNLITQFENYKSSEEWTPKPTPLCHWCSFCETNSDAKEYKHECPYYSLWTPTNKTYEVNVKYNDGNGKDKYLGNSTGQKRKIVVF